MLNFVAGRQNKAEIFGLRAPQDPLTNRHLCTPFCAPRGCTLAPPSPTFEITPPNQTRA